MTVRMARRLAWTAFAIWAVSAISSSVFAFLTERPEGGGSGSEVLFVLIVAAFPIVAILILARQPRNVVGWILMGIGLAWATGVISAYGEFALSRGLPGGAVAVAIDSPLWAPPVGAMGTFLLLRF